MPQTKSTGLKLRAVFESSDSAAVIFINLGTFENLRRSCSVGIFGDKRDSPGSPTFFTMPHTRNGRLSCEEEMPPTLHPFISARDTKLFFDKGRISCKSLEVYFCDLISQHSDTLFAASLLKPRRAIFYTGISFSFKESGTTLSIFLIKPHRKPNHLGIFNEATVSAGTKKQQTIIFMQRFIVFIYRDGVSSRFLHAIRYIENSVELLSVPRASGGNQQFKQLLMLFRHGKMNIHYLQRIFKSKAFPQSNALLTGVRFPDRMKQQQSFRRWA